MTPLRKLIHYFAPYKRIMVFGIACVFMTNLVRMTAPLVLRHAVDDLAANITHARLLEYAGFLFLIALTPIAPSLPVPLSTTAMARSL